MPQKSPWIIERVVDGIRKVDLSSWGDYYRFINEEVLDLKHQVWRGQRCSNWLLEPTLDRIVRIEGPKDYDVHLHRFKDSIRGRRGSHPQPLERDDDWWALGRHHSLATPLLDWVTSPFVAAYFAFFGEGTDQTEKRIVFALDKGLVEKKTEKIRSNYIGEGKPPIIEFIRSLSEDNPRLISQGGWFSRVPEGEDIEKWVKRVFRGETGAYILTKILIPDSDRIQCLRTLNQMNINHLTLFPDLYGASEYCNLNLKIPHY